VLLRNAFPGCASVVASTRRDVSAVELRRVQGLTLLTVSKNDHRAAEIDIAAHRGPRELAQWHPTR
jgi:hypothetical protein